jgi:hypothetical protein
MTAILNAQIAIRIHAGTVASNPIGKKMSRTVSAATIA